MTSTGVRDSNTTEKRVIKGLILNEAQFIQSLRVFANSSTLSGLGATEGDSNNSPLESSGNGFFKSGDILLGQFGNAFDTIAATNIVDGILDVSKSTGTTFPVVILQGESPPDADDLVTITQGVDVFPFQELVIRIRSSIITIKNSDNINTPDGNDLVLPIGSIILLYFDTFLGEWVIYGGTPFFGGGGGGDVSQWATFQAVDDVDFATFDGINIDRLLFAQDSGALSVNTDTGILLNSNDQFQFNTDENNDIVFSLSNNEAFVIDQEVGVGDNRIFSFLSDSTNINSVPFVRIVKSFLNPPDNSLIGSVEFLAGNSGGVSLGVYASINTFIEDNIDTSKDGTVIFDAMIDNTLTSLMQFNRASEGGISIFGTGLNMGSRKIISLSDPTSDQDAATKKYVDDNSGSATLTGIQDARLTKDQQNHSQYNVYLTNSKNGATFTSFTFDNGELFYLPIYVGERIRISQLAMQVTSAPGISPQFSFALYDSYPDENYPRTRLALFQDIDSISTGLFTSGTNITEDLEPGLYWMGFTTDVTFSVDSYSPEDALSVGYQRNSVDEEFQNILGFKISGSSFPLTATDNMDINDDTFIIGMFALTETNPT